MTARVIPFPGSPQYQEGRRPRARRFPHGELEARRKWGLEVSPRALIWVWRTEAKGLQQHVLLALANYHNKDDGQCNPSIAELADCTGLGATTIRRTLRQLEEAGWIKTDATKGGRRQRAHYRLQFDATAETRPERPSNGGGETRPDGPSIASKTPPERPGSPPETRPERPLNPAGAADVVPRTHIPSEPTTTEGAAVATPGAVDGGLFDEPSTPQTAERDRSKLAQAITNSYRERVPMSRHPAVLGIVKFALKTGLYSGEDILAAALRLADEGRSLTTETLRIEIEGFGQRQRANPGRQQPTDFDAMRERFKNRNGAA